MKMAKPSKDDIDAASDLASLLNDIDKGYYPVGEGQENPPTFFDEDDPEHLRHFYDKVKATLDRAPGYQGRVIGGMCHVIMWDKNEIVDPDSDTIDLHPKLVKALECAEREAERAAGGARDGFAWLTDERRNDAQRIIEELCALEAAKKPGTGVHGQVIGCEPWVIRTSGYGLACVTDATHFINEVLATPSATAEDAEQQKGDQHG